MKLLLEAFKSSFFFFDFMQISFEYYYLRLERLYKVVPSFF